jgi:hypothetical protein
MPAQELYKPVDRRVISTRREVVADFTEGRKSFSAVIFRRGTTFCRLDLKGAEFVDCDLRAAGGIDQSAINSGLGHTRLLRTIVTHEQSMAILAAFAVNDGSTRLADGALIVEDTQRFGDLLRVGYVPDRRRR